MRREVQIPDERVLEGAEQTVCHQKSSDPVKPTLTAPHKLEFERERHRERFNFLQNVPL